MVLSNVRKQFETATLAQPTIWVCCFPEKIMPMIYQVPSPVQADRRGEWKEYDPDSDTYDPCTAPVLPPPVDANKQLRRQVACLRSRIQKGGNQKVLIHYSKVIEELEQSMLGTKKEFCHKRTTSAASTAAPEGPEVAELEEDTDDEEIPEIPLELVESYVDKTKIITKKALPGSPLSFPRTLHPAPPSFAGSGRIYHQAPRPACPMNSMVMGPSLTLRPL